MRLRTDRQAGFTLLELIIVMVIMGLALGIVMARGPGTSPRLVAQTTAQQMIDALADARAQAILTDQISRFILNPAQRDWHTARHHGVIPRDLSATFTGLSAQPDGAAVGEIDFAPDGSSSGGKITLMGPAGRLSIAIDWLTGRVELVRDADDAP